MAAKKQSKKRKAKKRGRRTLFWGLLICAALVTGVLYALASVFCKVAAVTYSGQLLNYSMSDIVDTAGIAQGDNIFSFDKDEVENKLQTEFPLLDEFQVKRILPDRIDITAVAASEKYVLKNSGIYYVISASGRLIRRASESELPAGIAVVEGVSFTVKHAGEKISFSDEAQKESFESLLDAIGQYVSQVTYLDVSSADELVFHIGDKFVVNLGGDYQIDYKLQMVKSVIDNQNFNVRTYLDASIEGKVITRPYAE